MNRTFLTMAVIGATAWTATAVPTITVDRVQQRYPYSNVTDVDYTITGREGYDCDYNVVLSWQTDDRAGVMSNFLSVASCDLPTANGSHRVSWNTAADGADLGPAKVSVSAKLVKRVVTASEADYIIVDLSAGASATDYPARYVSVGSGYASSNFLREIYKTTKLVLKRAKAGEFWMGTGNVASGTSRHRVRLTKDFWMGIFELTQKQYKLVMNKNPSDFTTDGAGEKADARPVNKVVYDEFCNPTGTGGFLVRLCNRTTVRGEMIGGFCLPTEAEWEYVCRAGTETSYYWGETATAEEKDVYEWYKGNCSAMVHEVGLKQPNAWGFYDMLGNVWEWTRDWSYTYPAYSATEVSEDPEGTAWANSKVIRGGCFHYAYDVRKCGERNTNQTEPNRTSAGYNPALFPAYGCRICREVK